MLNFDEILTKAVGLGASDIHLKAGLAPIIRRNGVLAPLTNPQDVCDPNMLRDVFNMITTAQQRAIFEKNRELDLSYGVPGLGRFRLSIFQQRGSIRIVIRHLSHKIPQLEELGLPPVVRKVAEMERGLVLVTGVTGSGKSTTLAGMIEYINRNRSKHIITIEDPIEYVIKDRKSLITQRELGSDTNSFPSALRAALRQDPDVILIGEMRDLETINIALLAAETGHLVFSTLHTADAGETINRILAAYPPLQQTQIRLQLATSLRAVISQRLASKADGSGRVPVVEVMLNNARTSEMIADQNKTKDLIIAMEEGYEHFSMQSFDQALMKLVSEKTITFSEAMKLSSRPDNFALRAKGVTSMGGMKWEPFDGIAQHHDDTMAGETKIELDLELEKVENREIDDEEKDKTTVTKISKSKKAK